MKTIVYFLLQIGGERFWEFHARIFRTVSAGQGKISRNKQATEETKEEKALKDGEKRPEGRWMDYLRIAMPFDLLNYERGT